MFRRLTRSVVTAIAVAALLSIVVGPAPLAAHAECRARTARERDAEDGGGTIGTEGRAASPRTSDQGDERDPLKGGPAEGAPGVPGEESSDGEPASMASHPVHEVAKPVDREASPIIFSAACGEADHFCRFPQCGAVSHDQFACLQRLHQPAYRAHAPPADSVQSV